MQIKKAVKIFSQTGSFYNNVLTKLTSLRVFISMLHVLTLKYKLIYSHKVYGILILLAYHKFTK